MPKVTKLIAILVYFILLTAVAALTGSYFANRQNASSVDSNSVGKSAEVVSVAAKAVRNQPDEVRQGPHFREAIDCALCHSNSDRATAMRDAKERPIGPYDLWQASMMANSARDPFWRAVLSAEVVATPSQKALIEEKCTRCHAPMAAPAPESPQGDVLAYLKNGDQRSRLGLDGVSCTVCHQITEKGLGTDASFTGHFEINRESKIFGPHADPVTMPMQNHVGFTPTQGSHILKSGLCATCHTVITTSTDATGATVGGDFHEQSPYLEWRNSAFNDEVANPDPQASSCQACHMPTRDVEGNEIATRLAHNPGGRDFPFLKPRSPFGQHTFSGANTLMKQILRDNADSLGVVASAKAFNESIEQSRQFLKTRTATVDLKQSDSDSTKLTMTVTIRNLAGHKLPTAYPSRRVWIHLLVTDSIGNLVFSSGQYNTNGELTDEKNNVLDSELVGGPINTHKQIINRPSDAQVYETIMADAKGEPAFTLLWGASYVKDNRLLPLGWKADHADGAATRAYGVESDQDFVAGGDSVIYQIPALERGNYSVTAKLMFQVISPRHANELFRYDTPEVNAFKKMFQAADRTPEELANSTLTISVKN
jgi:Cytochrome c554 and c-prime